MLPWPVRTPCPPPPTFRALQALSKVPALVPGGRLSRALLQQYARAAGAHGLRVGIQRMRYDRRHAFQCLALTHALGDDDLRALSLQLFDLYQG